ncbi:syntaxin 5 [Oratosquilla oratoria]|uniref:syntaxin 5 n=1 Tax=Oratosquilla oratoria TaxID=337810 RepID=UPI003F761765
MTTRRRRVGSESWEIEPKTLGCSLTQDTAQNSAVGTTSVTLLPQVVNAVGNYLPWSPLSTSPNPANVAFYKKTDTVAPSSSERASFPYPSLTSASSHPSAFPHYQQVLLNPLSHSGQYNVHHGLQNSVIQGDFVMDSDQGGLCNTSGGYRSEPNLVGLISENSKEIPNSSGTCWVKSESYSNFGSLNSVTFEDSMAARDRTQEFMRIVRSQQGSYSNGSIPHKESKRPRDLRQYTDFMQRAKLIGRTISTTYAKLEKLTHLAKKRSLFDDGHDREIQELTGSIRHDLTSLTKQLEDLRQRSVLNNGGGSTNHIQKHSSNLVGSLQSRVANITQLFKDVLEIRTENLKKQAERREHFTGGAVSGELPPSAMAGHYQGSVLLADDAAAAATSSDGAEEGQVAINMGGNVYQQQLQLIEEQDTYLQRRAETMKTIESTIVELGQMFSQLATMVKEQEELVERIDSNVDDAEMNVEAAHSELLKYFKSVSSNRMLMIKVFGVMIFFFVIFVVFMA